MDKIEKLFRKISPKDRQQIRAVIFLIEKAETTLLNIKKLGGSQNQYRARVGKYRIIFKREGRRNIIIEVSLRNEKTYKSLG